MKFSIVIPAIRSNTIKFTIESICNQSHQNWELVVVGQADDDDLFNVVEAYTKKDRRVRYHHINRRGTTRARNAGVQSTDGEIIAFIDDDCEASFNWLETFTHIFNDDPDIGLIGGAVIKPPKTDRGVGVCCGVLPSESIYDPVTSPYNPPKGWDWIGCNFALRRRIYQTSGPFDIYLGPGTDFPSGEDTDYKLRLESMGVKMATTPSSVVYHTHGWRLGIKAAVKNARNYAYGNSGLAGKLTLMGDPRGCEWLKTTRIQCMTNWLVTLRPYRLPVDLYRILNSVRAYNLCIQNYYVESNLLQKKSGDILQSQ